MRIRADGRSHDRAAARPATAAPRRRSGSADPLQWWCRPDYRRTDGRPINSLLMVEEGAGKREWQAHTPWQQVSGKNLTRTLVILQAEAIVNPVRGVHQGGSMSRVWPSRAWAAAIVVGAVVSVTAAGSGVASIKSQDLREWL